MAEMQKRVSESGAEGAVERREEGEVGGHVTLSENVVEKIAGMAARDISGIHSLGRSRFISFGEQSRRGIDAQIGETEAALDVDIVLEYGADLRQLASELRQRVATDVERMAHRKVVEVNINIVDIHLAEAESEEPEPQSRVQ